jgi:APA family basic amino acid/polyamine antiporter
VRYFVDVEVRIAAVFLIVVLTAIIASGIRRSIWLTAGLVVLQVGGLLLVIFAGAPHIGDTSLTDEVTVSGVLGGAALIFFAFIGFDEIVTLSEETQDASRTIPRALLLALGVSTVLYVLVAVASISVVGVEAIASSDTPLTEVLAHNWGGRAGDIIAVIALASTTNTTLLVLTAASRLLYGMSRDGSLPAALSHVSRRGEAPWIAALAASAVALAFVMIGDITLVASVTDFAVYAIFVAVNGSLIALRFKLPDAPRSFRTPLTFRRVPLLPVLGIATIGLVIGQLEAAAWLIGCGAFLSGALVWAILHLLRARQSAHAVI